MILQVRRVALAAIVVLIPALAQAGDGTFGVPPSGILMPPPPARTAALIPPERAAPEKQRVIPRVQQSYQPAPAEGAGRSRAAPPSEAPVHSPIVVPPKKKQFRAPTASVDPDYVTAVAEGRDPPSAVPPSPPVMAQGAAPEQKRGLFNFFRNRKAQPQPQPAVAYAAPVRSAPMQAAAPQPQPAPVHTASAASAAYQEHVASAPVHTASIPMQQAQQPAPQRSASRFSFGGARPSARASDGTPCGQLRGLFTSPAECR